MTVAVFQPDAECLAVRLQEGNSNAAESFAAEFGDRFRRFFLWHGVRPWVAEDLATDSVSHVVLNVHRFQSRGGGSFVAWCFRIAKNKLMDWIRDNRRMESTDSLADLPAPVASTDQTLGIELQAVVGAELDGMQERDREILILRYFSCATTFEEIAQTLRITPVAARTRYSRARRRLADRLKSQPVVQRWLGRIDVRAEVEREQLVKKRKRVNES
jgi:RNA polymerase sigma factor (sigma-70 family)